MKPVLAGNELAFGYGEPLFAGLEVAVTRGECQMLLGANGAGKTTLLRLLAGLRPPQAGAVLLDGRPLASVDAAERARKIGILHQSTPSADGFNVSELVLMGLYANMPARGWEGRREWTAVLRALHSVGAGHLARRPFAELSGGEQRRVLLARALVSRPEVLLLDEPLASLDPGFALEMTALLTTIKERGTAIVAATHDLGFASRLADRVLLMRRGQPARGGPVAEMLVGSLLDATYDTAAFGGRSVAADSFTRRQRGAGRDTDPPGRAAAKSRADPRGPHKPHGPDGPPRRTRSTRPARIRYLQVVGGAAALLAVAVVWAPSVGSTDLRIAEVLAAPWDWDSNPAAAVFFVARLPRVILAALVGAGLSLCGVVYQALLRNPLASPYTLGISAGATLGAFLGLRFLPPGGGEFLLPVASLTGALASTVAVFLLVFRRRTTPTTVLLLAGVALNYTLSAGILLLQYLSDHTETAGMVRWLMGDLEGATYRLLLILVIGNLAGWAVLLPRGRSLNLLSLGADEAEAQGIDSRRMVIGSLLWAAWITGLAVAVVGPIGFVGIVVPHAVRLLAGRDHRVVLPAALLVGAAFLVACDAVSRTLLAPVELPIGVITASLGGPFFLILLLQRQGGTCGPG